MRHELNYIKKVETSLSLGTRVYMDLKNAIVNSEFLPGEFLHEEYLTELTGASRTPIREALLHLQRDGLVELVPRKGVRVWNLEQGLVSELIRMQILYEAPFFDASCLGDKSSEEFARMLFKMEMLAESIANSTVETEEWRERRRDFSEWGFRFHRYLVQCQHNSCLLDVYDLLMSKIRMYFNCKLFADRDFFTVWATEHRSILRAIVQGDLRTAKILHRKLLSRLGVKNAAERVAC